MTEIRTPVAELSPIKRALLEVRDLRSKLETLEKRHQEPIAIIGMGLRLPGNVNTPQSFWSLLRDGVDAIEEVPPERWNLETYYDPDVHAPGKVATRYGGFLRDVDQFDAAFFGISPREAESMDPQHRLLLEVTWEALEQAGQSPTALFGSQTGVFIGISNNDYFRLLLSEQSAIDPYVSTGNLLSVAAGRLSYTLGLHGPNVAVDTACSSSLTAVQMAVQSLRQGECDLALVGGVNLMLTPELTINFSKAQMMAPDGRCKTFDAAANGYVRSEGCALVVLKPLSAAVADGDTILALIRGAAITHDGRSGGLTAPNGPAQTAVIRQALANGGVQPHQISYVETHGTGTSLGDPIEVRALIEALAVDRAADNPLLIGSLKTNLGHLEAGAGIAGLIKVVLALQERQIPPHLHLQTLNPHIGLGDAPVLIPTALTPWTAAGGSRLAGVSSFGLSGTNAHVILEEAPAQPAADSTARPLHLLALSAKDATALRDLAGRYEDFLATPPAVTFPDLCFTANAGRAHFNQRLAVVAANGAEAQEKLAAYTAGHAPTGVTAGQVNGASEPDVTFLFTGLGGNYVGMGQQLFQTQPIFRAALERCADYTRPYLAQPLLSLLYPAATADATAAAALLQQMSYAQVALLALQHALTELWRAWGVEPTLVLGHSAGEAAAAQLAGVLSLEDSLKLAYLRGQVLERVGKNGVMVAVFAEAEQIAAVLAPYADQVAIAAYNGPKTVVISGAVAAMEEVLAQLRAAKIKSRPLSIAQAAHSPLLDPLLPDFEAEIADLTFSAPRLGLVSSVTGQLAEADAIATPAYWRQHLRQPVQFQPAMNTLHGYGQQIFVEIGPRPLLLALGQRCLPADTGLWLPSLHEPGQDWPRLLESLATLYTRGVNVNWAGFDRDSRRQRVALPTYPFQRKRYWTTILPTAAPKATARATAPAPETVWQAVQVAGQQQAEQGPFDLALPTYSAKWAALERLSTVYIVRALRALNGFTQPDEAYTLDEFMAHGAIQPVYRLLVQRWLQRLVAAGHLEQADARFRSRQPLPLPAEAEALTVAAELLADSPAVLSYVVRCGERLADVLTGRVSALDLLFPSGSSAQAEALYQHWALSRYYASLVRALAQGYIQAQPIDAPLHILEIGAGTGATTASVAPILPAARTVYHFTDVSDLFLQRAAEKFSAYPFMRYARLNIEQPPEEQGFEAGAFNLIIATNVLHATSNLAQTLAHVRTLLAPGGLLLINEVTEHLAWYDITTGLIEGWQRFEDELRQDQPLLSRAEWETVLHSHGFAAVDAWPAVGSVQEILGQHVLAALNPPGERSAAASSHHVNGVGKQHFVEPLAPVTTPEAATPHFRQQLQAAVPDEQQELLLNFVRRHVVKVLRLEPDHPLEAHQRFMDLGLDSLMALELRKRLSDGLVVPEDELSATLVFDYPTPGAVVDYLHKSVLMPAPLPAPVQPPRPAAAAKPSPRNGTALAQLSDAEVEALLLERLNQR